MIDKIIEKFFIVTTEKKCLNLKSKQDKKNSVTTKIDNRIKTKQIIDRRIYKKYFSKNYGLNVESRELYFKFWYNYILLLQFLHFYLLYYVF